ncbi:MAG: hypothetical protein K6F94_05455 [Bacteroidaceae bacterium]|nr:hypothetical protein [Bacteroidaceae bacterium]
MKKIVYIHGFASSGASGTATNMRNVLYSEGVSVHAPDIPVRPAEAITFLQQYIDEEKPDLIIGTSMGGFYTELMYGYKRILVNPSFQMARLLTFRGMGNYEFHNKRADGAKIFKVDKDVIAQFRELEKQSFKGVTPAERELVYGLFGIHDNTVNCQDLYKNHYGESHFATFDGEHRLNDVILKGTVLPLARTLLGLKR